MLLCLFYSLKRLKCSFSLSLFVCVRVCVEWKVSSAVLYSWVMEQRTICLSGQPLDCIPRSYECVSPANEKLAGLLLLAALRMDDFPALWRLLSTHGSSSIVFLVSTISCWLIQISGINNGTWHNSSHEFDISWTFFYCSWPKFWMQWCF